MSASARKLRTVLAAIKDNETRDANLSDLGLSKFALVKEVHEALSDNTALTRLDLARNQLADEGARSIAALLKQGRLPSLVHLDLSNNGISKEGARELLESILENFQLETLDINETQKTSLAIKDVQFRIDSSAFDALYGTSAEQARIRQTLESNIKLKKSLTGECLKLRLNKRGLTSVPNMLLQATALQALDLSSNRLTQIPKELGLLTNLEFLLLNDNQLSQLPLELSRLSRLQKLNLEHNRIEALPETLVILPQLTELNVSQNQLRTLPPLLLGMPQLTTLRCLNNPFLRDCPKEILSQGDSSILSYLRNIAAVGEVRLNRIKLIIVGNENVGKTTLVRALKRSAKGKTHKKRSKPSVATDGIEVTSVVTEDDPKKMQLNIWDFAGQEVYYSTHSFFLTQQAIYLLALNLTASDLANKLEYWLQLIRARAGSPPVVLCGTHADDPRVTQPILDKFASSFLLSWASRYPNIIGALPVSGATGFGVRELRKIVAEHARKQNWLDVAVPKNYVSLQQRVEQYKRVHPHQPIIAWQTFLQMSVDSGVPLQDASAAADFLVDSGDVLYFGLRIPALRDLVILDCQWLPRLFATIISLKSGFVKEGIFERNVLLQIWSSYDAELRSALLELFERFELLYRIPRTDRVVAPALLPELPSNAADAESFLSESPSGAKHVVLARVSTLEFVPMGLFGRLTVRLLRVGWEIRQLWRSGMMLERSSARLLVTLNHAARTVGTFVSTQDIQRSTNELVLLLEAFERLLEEWAALPCATGVPCPHCTQAQFRADGHVFPQSELAALVQAGTDIICCPRSEPPFQCRISQIAPDIALASIPRIDVFSALETQFVAAGGYAYVFRARLRDGRTVAVKRSTRSPTEPASYYSFKREAHLLSQLKHKNIVALLGIHVQPACLVLEYMCLGSLFGFLHQPELPLTIGWQLRLQIASDACSGLIYMHSLSPPIVHRDFKSPNVLLTIEDSSIVAKVSDVGCAAAIGILANSFKSRVVDNPIWLAPEVLAAGKYDASADVYGLGVILWELLTQQHFFADSLLHKLEESVLRGSRPPIPEGTNDTYARLITDAWAQSPERRPTAAAALERLHIVKREFGFQARATLTQAEAARLRDEFAARLRMAENDYSSTSTLSSSTTSTRTNASARSIESNASSHASTSTSAGKRTGQSANSVMLTASTATTSSLSSGNKSMLRVAPPSSSALAVGKNASYRTDEKLKKEKKKQKKEKEKKEKKK